jgi:hypothetical protein
MKNKAYIDEIELNIKGEIFIKLINGKKWHKLKLYNSPNLCGFYCKGGNHIFSNYENVEDFSRILEKILNLPISSDFYERIKKQLNALGFEVIKSNVNI